MQGDPPRDLTRDRRTTMYGTFPSSGVGERGLVNSSTLGVFGVGQNPGKSESERGRRALSVGIAQMAARSKNMQRKEIGYIGKR